VEKCGKSTTVKFIMSQFFSGSYGAKLDSKNRFVLPQALRYQLVEDGKLEFCIALSMGGCLAIYKKSDMQKIVDGFKSKRHIAKFQKFFTLFFSTLYHTGVDKIGRVTLPKTLKECANIQEHLMLTGSLDKIEIWSKEVFDEQMTELMAQSGSESFSDLWQEALGESDIESKSLENVLQGREIIKV
jgi:MraZ protein